MLTPKTASARKTVVPTEYYLSGQALLQYWYMLFHVQYGISVHTNFIFRHGKLRRSVIRSHTPKVMSYAAL